MWGSVEVQGSPESQTGWPQAHTNKKLVTTPFSARNSTSLELKPASQDRSLGFVFQPNGQTNKKVLMPKPASLSQEFDISSINLADSPLYGFPDDLFPDLGALGDESNSNAVIEDKLTNLTEDFTDLWGFNESSPSKEAALMSTKTLSSPMLMVDPKNVEGLEITLNIEGHYMTQDFGINPSNEGVQLNYIKDAANDQSQFVFSENINNIDLTLMDFNLINSVMSSTIGPDDPAFQNLIVIDKTEKEAVNSSERPEDLWECVDSEVGARDVAAPAPPVEAIGQPLPVVELVKRGRGRPRIERPVIPAAPKRRDRPPAAATNAAQDYTCEDPKEARYRRMRDLNNEASRRCRLNRKRKFETKDHEFKFQQDRNAELHMKVGLLTEQISKLKDAYIELFMKKNAK